ncbi:MAG: SBBP repeat-containing protein [Ignavibacteria bacterium]|nr:SBBP repeat-containing protein [Ignavibacteria bacterium]
MFLLRNTCLMFYTMISCSFAQVNIEWAARYNGPNLDGALAIAVDDAGYIYITGGSETDTSYFDYVIIKYTPLGDTVWVRKFNGSENGFDVARDIVVDDSGNVYLTGTSVMGTIKYDKDGNEIWFRRFGLFSAGYRIEFDQYGYIYVAGESNFNYALVKYNTDGDQIWAKTYNGPTNNDDLIKDIVIDNRANIIVTGGSKVISNDWDIATIKYSGDSGDTLWVRRYNGPSQNSPYDDGYGITVDDSGNVYITGWSDGINEGAQCITIKYSPDGDLLWERRFPSGGSIGYVGYDIINDPSGFVYVAARANGYDDTLLKYDREGNLIWSAQYIALHTFATNQPRLVRDQFGDIYMSSTTGDGAHAYYVVLKYNPDGDQIWEYKYRPPNATMSVNNAYDLYVDSSLNVYVTGEGIGGSGFFSDFDCLTIKLSQDPTTIYQDSELLPAEFRLLQNYPNPFNSVTNITFTLQQSVNVNMKIYTLLGEEITTLISKNYSAGTYTVIWDAGALPSGIYLCRLQAGEEQRVIKLLLMK